MFDVIEASALSRYPMVVMVNCLVARMQAVYSDGVAMGSAACLPGGSDARAQR